MSAIDAPYCKICESKHWPREPHQFGGETPVVPEKVIEVKPLKHRKRALLKHAAEPFKQLVESAKPAEVTQESDDVTYTPEEMRRVMSALGKRGGPKCGRARAEKLSPERRTE